MKQTILLFSTIISISLQSQIKFSTLKEWNKDKLETALKFVKEAGAYSVVIRTNNEIKASFGNVDKVSRVHSVRKAIIGALVFQNLQKINLNTSLKDLRIQDMPIPLNNIQRKTKVIHLLKSISGVNHPTGSQIGSMQKQRDLLLGTKTNVPGTRWAYNNWDYNVLTTILEQKTELNTKELFRKGIASQLKINDFEIIYKRDTMLSKHAKAGFRLSTKDMAKFGQLFLNKGNWNGKQLIPEKWIDKITTDFVKTKNQSNERYGHGYLWWIQDKSYARGLLPKNSYVATGAWGQRILVVPQWNSVIALKTMTEIPVEQRKRVTRKEFERFVVLLAKSKLLK